MFLFFLINLKRNYSDDIFRIRRCDFKTYVFSTRNILLDKNTSYYKYLRSSRYRQTFSQISQATNRSSSNSRKNVFYQFGSTNGYSTTPRFEPTRDGKSPNGNKYQPMLPRPIVSCRPGNKGYKLLQQNWLIDLIKEIEEHTISYLIRFQNEISHGNELLKQLLDFRENVDKNILVCGTIFNQMIVIGKLDHNSEIVNHVDKDDAISCILTLGDITSGGATNYYDGLKAGTNVPTYMNGNLMHSVPFQHGRLQIGNYRDIVHGVSKWEGTRITIDLNTKIGILNHYCVYNNYFLNQYKEAGYPSGEFCAKVKDSNNKN